MVQQTFQSYTNLTEQDERSFSLLRIEQQSWVSPRDDKTTPAREWNMIPLSCPKSVVANFSDELTLRGKATPSPAAPCRQDSVPVLPSKAWDLSGHEQISSSSSPFLPTLDLHSGFSSSAQQCFDIATLVGFMPDQSLPDTEPVAGLPSELHATLQTPKDASTRQRSVSHRRRNCVDSPSSHPGLRCRTNSERSSDPEVVLIV